MPNWRNQCLGLQFPELKLGSHNYQQKVRGACIFITICLIPCSFGFQNGSVDPVSFELQRSFPSSKRTMKKKDARSKCQIGETTVWDLNMQIWSSVVTIIKKMRGAFIFITICLLNSLLFWLLKRHCGPSLIWASTVISFNSKDNKKDGCPE